MICAAAPDGGATLKRARCYDVPPGSVKELCFKHLLALNLRKLGDQASCLAPRSYVLQPGNGLEAEYAAFAEDFKISLALAVVKHLAAAPEARGKPRGPLVDASASAREPEGLWGREEAPIAWQPGPDASQPLPAAGGAAALDVCRRLAAALERGGHAAAAACRVELGEWEAIRAFSPLAGVAGAGADEAVTLLAALEGSAKGGALQLPLLWGGLWLLKPSCGQFGRGILLLDRLPEGPPEQLLMWAAGVGRGGHAKALSEPIRCGMHNKVRTSLLLNAF